MMPSPRSHGANERPPRQESETEIGVQSAITPTPTPSVGGTSRHRCGGTSTRPSARTRLLIQRLNLLNTFITTDEISRPLGIFIVRWNLTCITNFLS
ncbi:hypothetical protein AVEN_235554-1 [Araneus ventricosus]|uniref:Uncharacterized protein n=1 Tax=Araneus ventricosus TaxID=182803 RepID=A0A4Y2ITI1_ARAVE|nr:hypothetical protein AVEN_235554-1 [Araneus ventricosus]